MAEEGTGMHAYKLARFSPPLLLSNDIVNSEFTRHSYLEIMPEDSRPRVLYCSLARTAFLSSNQIVDYFQIQIDVSKKLIGKVA